VAGVEAGVRRAVGRAALLCLLSGLLSACEGEGGRPVSEERFDDVRTARVLGGDPRLGRAIVAAIECGVCHQIPGIEGAHGIVGPPLEDFGERPFIGGVIPNQPELLVQWVKDAPSLDPDTGMPELPLTHEEARHVAAYLLTLR